jgi:crossover junction endodeoxyribonuclease RuvC
MTLRVTLGFDPGNSGALAVLHDGVPAAFHDMPTMERKGGRDVDPFALAAVLRGVIHSSPGAHVHAVVERVAMRSYNSRGSDQQAGIGVGTIRGVLGALGIRWTDVYAQTWKRHHGLLGTSKDAARIYATRKWPHIAHSLSRKRDNGRADAALIGAWAWETEQHTEQAA